MQAPITAASKIILNNWKLSGMTVISAALTFGDRMKPMSFSAISFYTMGLGARSGPGVQRSGLRTK